MDTVTITATIASGASLSDAVVPPPGFKLVGIHMPAGWDAASLTFQGCESAAGTYANLYDAAGTEVILAAAVDRFIAVASLTNPFAGTPFLKIRSGTSGSAVAQNGGARSLICVFRP